MSCAHPSSRAARFCLGDESPVRPVGPSPLKMGAAEESLMQALSSAPVMTITPYAAYKRTKKPLKSILKRPDPLQSSERENGGSAPRTRQRRCVSFSGFSNSRWDADTNRSASAGGRTGKDKGKTSSRGRPSRMSVPHVNVNISSSTSTGKDSCICCITGGNNHHHQPHHSHNPASHNHQRNFNWTSPSTGSQNRGRSKSSCSPRLPRRDASSVSPTRTKVSSLKPPRRRLSHENLFQHKIDFFLEQTAEHGKKIELQQRHHAKKDDPCLDLAPVAPSKNKDIEELEMSLISMQNFLVALHSVPDNQKLLQKHLEVQTRVQDELRQQKELHHVDDEDEYDDEDDDDSSCDDDDDDLDDLYDEMIRHRPLPALSMLGGIQEEE
ncbi:expressed unknown protein [Seminavis robusta]|uniref:Uncharacterized protein n=1 Tax=Seminavis robusta TaxID=568900 RepID=A0A9N8HTR9_9STRA|nr:expressed unknown protein [Seminavis robusta]|eukprot:Sro1929_g306080.1 n/a (382) ;mRNA; r:8640-9785